MSALLFLPEAVEDLHGIWQHLVDEASIDIAEKVLDQLRAACLRYSDQPQLGQLRTDLAPTIRCFHSGQLVVFYEPVRDGIHVAQIIHGARNLAVHFHKYRSY